MQGRVCWPHPPSPYPLITHHHIRCSGPWWFRFEEEELEEVERSKRRRRRKGRQAGDVLLPISFFRQGLPFFPPCLQVICVCVVTDTDGLRCTKSHYCTLCLLISPLTSLHTQPIGNYAQPDVEKQINLRPWKWWPEPSVFNINMSFLWFIVLPPSRQQS